MVAQIVILLLRATSLTIVQLFVIARLLLLLLLIC